MQGSCGSHFSSALYMGGFYPNSPAPPNNLQFVFSFCIAEQLVLINDSSSAYMEYLDGSLLLVILYIAMHDIDWN